MALKLKCPCGERLVAPESAIGKRGKCSKCGRSFVIPDPKAARPKAGKVATPHSQAAAKAKASAKPKVAAKSKAPDPDFPDLPELGSGISGFDDELPDLGADQPGLGGGLSADMGSELDDFLNEETSNPFQSPTASSTAAPEPSLAKSATGDTRKQMKTLANGIKLVFWGTALLVISWFTIVGGFLVNTAAVIFVGVGMILLSAILTIVGRVVCLGGPKHAAGRGLLVASVVCDLGGIGVGILVGVGVLPDIVNVVSPLLNLSTLILFLLFIKALTASIGQPHLADNAKEIVIYIGITIALVLTSPIVAALAPLLIIVSGLGILVLGLLGFFKYLYLLQHTAEAVRP